MVWPLKKKIERCTSAKTKRLTKIFLIIALLIVPLYPEQNKGSLNDLAVKQEIKEILKYKDYVKSILLKRMRCGCKPKNVPCDWDILMSLTALLQ